MENNKEKSIRYMSKLLDMIKNDEIVVKDVVDWNRGMNYNFRITFMAQKEIDQLKGYTFKF